jgi:DNA polymerase III delta prime subunit
MENYEGQGYKPDKHLLLSDEEIIENIEVISREAGWLGALLAQRIREAEDTSVKVIPFSQLDPPLIDNKKGPYASFVNEMKLSHMERLLLIITLIPHYQPSLLTDALRHETTAIRTRYTKAGGYIDPVYYQFIPTFQTVLFLLAEADSLNSAFYKLALNKQSKLFRDQIISLRTYPGQDDENMLNFVPTIAGEYVHYLKTAEKPRPDFGRAFPASLVTTPMDWDDLVLQEQTMHHLEHIMKWMKMGKKLMEMDPKANRSFPCLFYGPPGTGKSLAAKLIGKHFRKDVFRIDLSMIVSKYIGETEKNLAHLFDRAEGKDWILFFDEADALFGKRTDISDAKDKWANLEMSYLLQRMEEYTGLTILATNIKNNIDPAMVRRFQAMVHFPYPLQKERELLWQKAVPSTFNYDPSINISKLARYEFTGANIANMMKSACIDALCSDTTQISAEALTEAIKREFEKENRTP